MYRIGVNVKNTINLKITYSGFKKKTELIKYGELLKNTLIDYREMISKRN